MSGKFSRFGRYVAFFLIALVAMPLVGIELTVEYVDGYLDLRDGDEWIELYVGESITEEDTIRLVEDSIAEIYGPGVKLTLTKPGIYDVGTLLNASGEQRSVGLASVVGGKVASLFTERKNDSQAAVMGVRGAKSESNVQWMTGDTAELVKTGREHLEASELEDALALFEEAYDFAEIDEETEVLFYLGYTNYVLGNVRVASDFLGEIYEVDTEAEFFPNLLLLNGQILAETFAFEDAVEWLSQFRDVETIDSSVRQTALLLEGVSHKALEAFEPARAAFAASVEIDAESDVGQAATQLLESLD